MSLVQPSDRDGMRHGRAPTAPQLLKRSKCCRAIFEYWYERQEFLFVDLALAELLRRRGRTTAADTMLTRITGKARDDHNIIPEMYVALPCELFPGKIGDPTGAVPMVGYGAGAYILHILERGSATRE